MRSPHAGNRSPRIRCGGVRYSRVWVVCCESLDPLEEYFERFIGLSADEPNYGEEIIQQLPLCERPSVTSWNLLFFVHQRRCDCRKQSDGTIIFVKYICSCAQCQQRCIPGMHEWVPEGSSKCGGQNLLTGLFNKHQYPSRWPAAVENSSH